MKIKQMNKIEKRDTVGKIASELMQKQIETTDPVEQMSENLKDYDKNIQDCIDRYKKIFDGPFYVVVHTRSERLMANVLRLQFTGYRACPTPQWDQTVYLYNPIEDSITFLWVVPSKQACRFFMKNALHIPLDQRELLKFVLDFNDGTLLALAKKLNGEQLDSPLTR